MPRSRPTVTEFSFFLCGALIVLLGWVADLLGTFEVRPSADHTAEGALPLRLFLTMFGVAFATIGIAYENFPQILADAETAKRYVVALLFLADGSLHLYALNDHLGETFGASFFAAFSGLQLAAAFVIPYLSHRFVPAWLGITAFLLLAYVVTRTFAVWPISILEEVEPLGVVSKLVEGLTLVTLLSLVQSERAKHVAPLPPISSNRR